ncbi:hypothetical protein FLL45_00295 [Aliikangiella marina]|uniref:Uncharacterized protein n=1 Tax=Aliikangiella marina TaxID=1712262 RepID=A0A545TH28_9GAMM|nr:hypothetical protein [Aliikangiella marina]TQV76441.1 hypothetical protein FLL45_00295 [Aliikangiella marina]
MHYPKEYIRYFFVILITILLIGCDKEAASSKVTERKITAEEQGVIEYIEKDLNKIINNYSKLVSSREKFFRYQQQNKTQSMNIQLKKYYQSRDRLLLAVTSANFTHAKHLKLLYPSSMYPLFTALYNFYGFQYSRYSNGLSVEKEKELIRLAAAVVEADRQLAYNWRKRKSLYKGPAWEGGISVQNSFSPIKISYTLDGGFSIKYRQKIGPGLISVSAGQGRRGIKTLVLEIGNTQRRFAIGHKNISLDVPASTIVTRGNILYVRSLKNFSG